jgi:hypothetical protein
VISGQLGSLFNGCASFGPLEQSYRTAGALSLKAIISRHFHPKQETILGFISANYDFVLSEPEMSSNLQKLHIFQRDPFLMLKQIFQFISEFPIR